MYVHRYACFDRKWMCVYVHIRMLMKARSSPLTLYLFLGDTVSPMPRACIFSARLEAIQPQPSSCVLPSQIWGYNPNLLHVCWCSNPGHLDYAGSSLTCWVVFLAPPSILLSCYSHMWMGLIVNSTWPRTTWEENLSEELSWGAALWACLWETIFIMIIDKQRSKQLWVAPSLVWGPGPY